MDSKCSLYDFNSYLQFVGLLSLIIILFIAVLYYLRVYHNNILEKYDEGSVDIKTIESKTGSLNNRSTYPKDKYPGRNKNEISSSTDANDKYKLRDCKVYFTESKDKIDECDRQSDNMKKCSYTFDGWEEFDTYTDNYGNVINYPKKTYTNTKTNSDEFINSDFTSKCFKMFDYGGKGSAKPFEYSENKVVKYDSKGTLNNTEIDTNIFGGSNYTSIQFLNKDNAGDNFTNVLDSICSLKYNTIDSIRDKKFYKLLFDSNKNIIDILKVQLNSGQTVFDEIKKNAVFDFAILATHGIKYDTTNNSFKIFIKDEINMKAKIYVFNYVSYVCPLSQIKNYTTTMSELNVTSFAIFRNKASNNSANFRLNGVNMNIIDWSKYTGNIDYKFAIIDDLNAKIDDRKKTITDNEKQIINGLNSNIASKDTLISEAYSAKNNFSTDNNKFVDILNLTKNDGITKIFNYNKGYNKNTIKELNIPNGVKCKYINSNEIYLEFNNNGNSKTPYSFIVPETGYICDILVVGGGGAGGGAGGAGGGGDVKEFKDITLSAGIYNINVGKGGVTVDNNQAGTVGNESTFIGNNLDIKLAGGGGGGGYGWNVGICEWRWYGWVWRYRCWKNDNPGITPTIAPTANYIDPKTGVAQKSSGAGGGVRQGSGRATADGSSGSGGTNVDNNWETGGAGGGAASSSEGGNAGSSRRWNGLYTGDGGKGVKSSITGESVEYGGGGSGGRWNGGVDTYGVSSGGAGNFKNGYFIEVDKNKGGGGIMYRNGGSGVVIIRIKNINTGGTNLNISIETDKFYKLPPVSQITFPSYTLQNNIITSFIFLQKGYYRFRVDMGNNPSYTNPNILYSELMIYDELNLKDTTNYNCIIAFKYSKYNNEMKPSYLKQFIKITTTKFYKVAYYYVSHNNSDNAKSSNFNIFFKYLDAPPVRLENTLPPNLIAWYKFDSNYKEDSNLSGTKYTLTKNGNISNILNEDGKNFINTSGGSLATSINLARKSFSISVWRRMRNSGHSFFVLQGSAHGKNKYLHIGARDNNAYCLAFYANDLECGVGTGTASSYPEDVNVWTHLVYVVEETVDKKYNRKIYRNGGLISQDQSGTAFVGWGNLRLGNNIDIDISNFLVFNRAISKEEVEILYYNDYNFTSTSSPQTTYIEINKTVNKNDESLFTRNNIPSINVPANDYLFCGNVLYTDYKNPDNTIMDLFTDIKYNNNNYINYQKLANYIYADPIDYFRITILRSEKTSIERQIREIEDNLPVIIRNDVEIADINRLLTAINNIKYNEILPIDDVTIKPNSGILNIFGDNYARLLTYDRVNNYNSLVSNPINTTTSSSIYIEAIN